MAAAPLNALFYLSGVIAKEYITICNIYYM